MKIKKLIVMVLTGILSVGICFTAGCLTDAANKLAGSWKLDLTASAPTAGEILNAAALEFEGGAVVIKPDYKEGYFNSHDYSVNYALGADGSAKIYSNQNGIYGEIGPMTFRLEGEKLILEHFKVRKESGSNTSTIEVGTLCFVRGTANLGTEDPGPGPGPVGPENPPVTPSDSRYEQIKTAYSNAGYVVDVGFGDVDPTLQATLKQMQELYQQLGCGVTYIGKNLDNVLNMELYMLIAAGTEGNAAEYAAEFEKSYPGKVRRHGVDIIVSVSVLGGSLNFAPFESATA